MRPRLVVLSGPVAAGKTELAEFLVERFGAIPVKSRELMRLRAERASDDLPNERSALQDYGARLDEETGGRWIADDVAETLRDADPSSFVVLDSIRVVEQLAQLHRVFGRNIVHVHLTASELTLTERYASRSSSSEMVELASYEQVRANPIESNIASMRNEADVVIETDRSSAVDVGARCAAQIGLVSRVVEPCVDVLVGGQWGSEGKGNVAFYLAPEYDVLVRVGGPNAGHKVPIGDGSFTHRSLPSGTLANEDALLVIGPGAVIDLDVLLGEIADCRVEVGRLAIDPAALIIEPEDVATEAALKERIGSTGKGVGAATARRIVNRGSVVDHAMPVRCAGDVADLKPHVRRTSDVMDEMYANGGKAMLEGTQGTSLSLFHGSYPHVTSRDTTVNGCLAEAGIGPGRVRRIVGVFRTYPIRVGGTSGPMGVEIDFETVAGRAGLPVSELQGTEIGSVSGNTRRIAEFNWEQLRQSTSINTLTDIALTFADYVDVANRDARRFDQLTEPTIQFVEDIERVSGVSVSLITTRFEARSVIDRRSWS